MEELHEKGKGFPFTFITRLRKGQRLDKLNECVAHNFWRQTKKGLKLKRLLRESTVSLFDTLRRSAAASLTT